MGDGTDHADIMRFMRSQEGQSHLGGIREMLIGRRVVRVEFSNETHAIATTLALSDGGSFIVFQPSLEVGAIREQFADVIEREYYVDFPERKPYQPSQ